MKKRFEPGFKAKVAREASRGEKTLTEIKQLKNARCYLSIRYSRKKEMLPLPQSALLFLRKHCSDIPPPTEDVLRRP